eukprot:TRINITY_DN40225_c0_g1_i1.p1 TRINITY_DN40225_c0_g1~~TRINITY_DN40225_c0_g1_i1.p1  ORF type:complete len:284 (-),score=82.47 TRINITY_DN40225_c0_g1_i1:183-1034(-)
MWRSWRSKSACWRTRSTSSRRATTTTTEWRWWTEWRMAAMEKKLSLGVGMTAENYDHVREYEFREEQFMSEHGIGEAQEEMEASGKYDHVQKYGFREKLKNEHGHDDDEKKNEKTTICGNKGKLMGDDSNGVFRGDSGDDFVDEGQRKSRKDEHRHHADGDAFSKDGVADKVNADGNRQGMSTDDCIISKGEVDCKVNVDSDVQSMSVDGDFLSKDDLDGKTNVKGDVQDMSTDCDGLSKNDTENENAESGIDIKIDRMMKQMQEFQGVLRSLRVEVDSAGEH